MDNGRNDASADLHEEYVALDDEIEAALTRGERMRVRATQIRNKSEKLRKQASTACKTAQVLINTFPSPARQRRQPAFDRHPTVESTSA